MEQQTPSDQEVIQMLLERIRKLTEENEALRRRLVNVWGDD